MRLTKKSLIRAILVAGLAANAIAALPIRAQAISCSDRKGVCIAYCDQRYHGSGVCYGKCDQLLAECRATGCWNSAVTARRCGISRD
jgi:hypothetical protein